MARMIPEEHSRMLIDAYQSGMSALKSAALLGYSEATCLNALRRNGIASRPVGEPRHISPDQEAEIVATYNAGATIRQLGEVWGYSDGGIFKILTRGGASLRHNKRYTVDDRYFASIDSDTKAYILGLLTADGCVNGPPYDTVSLQLQRRDEALVEAVRVALGYTGAVRQYKCHKDGKTFHQSVITVSSADMVTDLIALGVTPAKSLTVRPWVGPERLMPAYWRGVLDGDGSWIRTKTGHRCGLVGSKHVVEGFLAFVKNLTGDSNRIHKHVNIWGASFSHRDTLQAIARSLYGSATIWLARKRVVADEILALPASGRKLYRDWSEITKEQLLCLHASLKTWRAVSKHFGMKETTMTKVKNRLGLIGHSAALGSENNN